MIKLNIIILLFSLTACFSMFACSSDSNLNKDDILAAKINDYHLTKNAFNEQFSQEMEYQHQYKATAHAKQEFLDILIKNELLIQEAKKQGLDKKKDFISAIERHWKSTLIKHLMEIKHGEILKNVMVSDKGIKARYDTLKSNNATIPPLDEIEKEIADELLGEKRTKAIEKWETQLYEQARITINSDFINQ
ncbi:MAG: hypothetical protein GY857_10290 [Desulfobacula sp.]|nr:hypothetical protein [Desulfobacula sp.]